MKQPFLSLLFAPCLSTLAAQIPQPEDVRLYALWQGETKPYVALSCDAAPDRIKAQPAWDPLSQPIPLQPHDAAQIATKWMRGQPNGAVAFSVASYRIQRCPKPFRDRWFYTIDFTFEQHRETPTRFAIVLFDGTVVEPKLHEPPP